MKGFKAQKKALSTMGCQIDHEAHDYVQAYAPSNVAKYTKIEVREEQVALRDFQEQEEGTANAIFSDVCDVKVLTLVSKKI